MDFDFSAEQTQLRHEVRRLLDSGGDLASPRRLLEDDQRPHDLALWQAMASMGLQGAAIDETYGGAGLGYLELCVIAEELGRSLAPVPMASSIYLAAEFLKAAGTAAQKQTWLPGLAAGDKIGTFAGAEGQAPGVVDTYYRNGAIHGVKLPVPDGESADVAVVLARVDASSAAIVRPFLVDLSHIGVARTRVATIDPTRRHARLEFTNVPAEPLDGNEDPGLTATILDRAAVLIAFEQIGGADRALAMACAYAMQRMAFGRKIGSFQSIKHMLADMFVSLALARGNAYYGAWALDTGANELPLAAASARLSATQAFRHCAKNNIQVHGGMGFTWEFDCHLFYRRAQLLALNLESTAYWENQLIRSLPQRAA